MELDSFIETVAGSMRNREQLVCCEEKDLNGEKKYDVVVFDRFIEYIPVFEMKALWEKTEKLLRPGGVLVINTPIFSNPNQLDEDDKKNETMKTRCNKQTKGTLLRTCLENEWVMADSVGNQFAIVRKADLPALDQERKERFLSHHRNELSTYNLELKEKYTNQELRKLVPGAGRLMIGCVAEDNPKFRGQALRLVQSIRLMGGSAAGANLFVCMVDSADPEFVEQLEKLGVFVRIVKRFSTAHPPSNKLRLFELSETSAYDTVMLLDCDTLVVQDVNRFIDGEHFQAEIAGKPTVPHQLFQKLFSHFKLQLLQRTYKTALTHTPTIFYCNAGVLIFPLHILQQFYPVWKKYTLELIKKKHILGSQFNFCEQASLTLAYADHQIPFKKLPEIMNFHLLPNPRFRLRNSDPAILHYHKFFERKDRYLYLVRNPLAHKRIKEFTAKLRIGRKRGSAHA